MVHELFPIARDLMTQGYLAMRPSLPLLDAVARLEHHPEDTAFVLDEHDRFLGVLTEKECLRILGARAYDDAIADTVKDVLCATPRFLAPTTDAYAIAQAFLSCSCGMLPVVENDRVIGGVSQLAMLRVFLTIFRQRAAALGSIEQRSADLKGRPDSIEQLQRVSANLDREQLTSLLRRTE